MRLVIALGLAALAGCTAAYPAASPGITPGQARLGGEPFGIGPVQVLIATDNPYVLLHELKHYFEGNWHD